MVVRQSRGSQYEMLQLTSRTRSRDEQQHAAGTQRPPNKPFYFLSKRSANWLKRCEDISVCRNRALDAKSQTSSRTCPCTFHTWRRFWGLTSATHSKQN